MTAFRRPSRKAMIVASCIAGAAVLVPSAAVAVSSSAAAASVTAELQMSSSSTWYGGGQFVVQNPTDRAADWTLSFTVPSGSFENHASWATNTAVHGDHVVITPKEQLAPGASSYISFGIAGDGTAELAPEACDVDGADVVGCSTGDGAGPEEPGDTTPPSVVHNLTTQFSHDDEVHVMWEKATDDVAVDHYELDRDGKHLMDVEGSKRMLDVPGHTAGETYEYRVRALDAAGNRGGWSEVSTVTMPGAPVEDTQAPSKPGDLVLSDVTARSAVVSWDAATDDVAVTGYTAKLYDDGVEVTSKQVATTKAVFTGLDADTRYTATVTASDAVGNTGVGSAATFTTKAEAPVQPGAGTPGDFTATAGTYRDGDLTMHRVVMGWKPDAAASTRYEVWLDGKRAQTLVVVNAGDATQKPTDAQVRYLDLGTEAGTHAVKLRAQLADGSWSAFTPEITVR